MGDYKAVMSGQTFSGVNEIAGSLYQTVYRPFRDADGRIVGVLYVGIPHEDFGALRESIMATQLGETGYVYAMDGSGVLRVHPTSVGDNVAHHDWAQDVLGNRSGTVDYVWEGRAKRVAYEYFEPFDWYLCAGAYLDEFEAPANALATELIIEAIIFALVGVGIVRWVSGRMAKRVTKVRDAIDEVAQGDGDLTRRIEADSADELGSLAGSFNQFVEKIHELVTAVNDSAREVAGAATQIAASSEEMSSNLVSQQEQTTQISGAVEQLSQSIVEVSSKTTEAARSAESSGELAGEGGDRVRETVTSMETLRGSVAESARRVQSLGERGEQIGQIVETINDIAEQTNLLALNAAIEAARAGEHGRGFAVVADEVRKLADRTVQATQEISESIGTVQRETQSAVEQIGEGESQAESSTVAARGAGESLSKIVAEARTVAELVTGSASALEQQSAASQQIARTVESIQGMTEQSTEASSQAAAAAASLSAKAEELQSLVGRFKL